MWVPSSCISLWHFHPHLCNLDPGLHQNPSPPSQWRPRLVATLRASNGAASRESVDLLRSRSHSNFTESHLIRAIRGTQPQACVRRGKDGAPGTLSRLLPDALPSALSSSLPPDTFAVDASGSVP